MRLLDLYSGAGGAAMGYHRAGFDVLGVDIAPQPRYPFSFVQADALTYLSELTSLELAQFDAIHASPPCQAYTTMNNRHGSSSPPLIAETREALQRTGLPWVIENVPGARAHLIDPVRITGAMVGCAAHRPRLFEASFAMLSPPPVPDAGNAVAVYGKNDGRRLWTRSDGSELRVCSLSEARAGMGIDWMEWDELREAIPPSFTEWVGAQLLAHVQTRMSFLSHPLYVEPLRDSREAVA
jgi:DNA (cytosine-5)-methyltransferase 1